MKQAVEKIVAENSDVYEILMHKTDFESLFVNHLRTTNDGNVCVGKVTVRQHLWVPQGKFVLLRATDMDDLSEYLPKPVEAAPVAAPVSAPVPRNSKREPVGT